MSGTNLIRIEEAAIEGGKRVGSVLMTLGKVLLWMDCLPFAFVFVGLRGGSRMWLWWLLAQGIVGLVLLSVGAHKRGSLSD